MGNYSSGTKQSSEKRRDESVMNKEHFYERLSHWKHLRFNDVVLRERTVTPVWNSKYEIYILDNTRLSAQLYIRTTYPEENTAQVMEQYLRWLHEFNATSSQQMPGSVSPSTELKCEILPENCHRSSAVPLRHLSSRTESIRPLLR
ncbi:hypothetical protein ACFFW8_25730 [Erwinia tracheiphila]